MRITILYILMGAVTLSAGLTIDELLESYDEVGPAAKRYRLEWRRFLKEEEGLHQNRILKVDYRGEMFRESSTDTQIRRKYDDVEKGQFGVYYDALYYEGVYEFEDSGYYRDRGEGLKENRVGIRKSLNDLIYSEKKYEKNYIKIKRSIVRAGLIYDYLIEAEKIVDSYKEILILQHSLEMDLKNLEDYDDLYEIARRKAEVGEGLALEADYLRAEGLELRERVEYNRALKDIKLMRIARDTGLDIGTGRRMEDLPQREDVGIRLNDYLLKKSHEEVRLGMEEVRLYRRREQTEFTLGGDYDTERELWSLRFNIDGSLFEYPLDSALEESDVEIRLQDVLYMEEMRESDLRELEEELEYLKNMLQVRVLKKENRNKTVEIAREMYGMGYITAKKLIEEKKSAREAEMEYLEILHELGAFEYKMYLRGKVESVWYGIIN